MSNNLRFSVLTHM